MAVTPAYVETGHLVYALGDVLFALPFDLADLEVRGGPVPLVAGVERGTNLNLGWTANYSFSENGSLVYVPGVAGAATTGESLLVLVDRQGNAEPFTDELRDYRRPRVSPDGTRVAVEVVDAAGGEQATHVWLVNLETGIGTQLTFGGPQNMDAVWTSDSETVVFRSNRRTDGAWSIYQKSADGSGEAELVYQGEAGEFVVARDSRNGVLAFHESIRSGSAADADLKTVELDGDGSASEFLVTSAIERSPTFSPDGQWIAYHSDELGSV